MNQQTMIDNPNALGQYVDLMGQEGVEFIIDIIDTFLADAPNNLRQLDESMASQDSVTFRRAAHTLKTGCATVGAVTLSQKFLLLEQAGANNNILGAHSILNTCKRELVLLGRELVAKKNSLVI